MVWFKKSKEPEVLDFSLMQKRGLLAKEGIKQKDVVEINSKKESSGEFDFLSGLAGATSNESPGPITE